MHMPIRLKVRFEAFPNGSPMSFLYIALAFLIVKFLYPLYKRSSFINRKLV